MKMPHRQWWSASAFLIGSLLIPASLAVAQQPTPPPKHAVDTLTRDLERLMQIEVVVAGSKREQQARDVASFVSVVSAAEIQEHGYRTLADILRTLPGFYVSNDRNYSYVGVRGFSRPGDWNSRVLLLLNGLRTNENVFDLAYIGEEFSRRCGPDRASRSHSRTQLRDLRQQRFFRGDQRRHQVWRHFRGCGALDHCRQLRDVLRARHLWTLFANGLDLVASGTYSDGKGRNLYFPEYDAPATNNGIANGDDHEGFRKLLVTALKGNFSFQANNVSRVKSLSDRIVRLNLQRPAKPNNRWPEPR